MVSRFTTLAAAISLFAAACGAQAAPWFTDSFDSYAVDNLAGQGGWSGAIGPVKVETDFVQSGKSVQADYLLYGIGDVSRTMSSGIGYHYIDFDVACDMAGTALPGTNLGYVKILNETGAGEITRFYFAQQQFKVLTGPLPGNPVVVLDGVTNRQWYHIKLGVDLSANTIDAWVDGVQKIGLAQLYGSGTSIGRVTIGQWYKAAEFTKSATYVDNIVGSPGAGSGADLALSPMFGWTCWENCNVLFPFVLYDSATGNYKMYYAGIGAGQTNESVWDVWQTGIVTSIDAVNWSRRPDTYEPVLFCTKFPEGAAINPEEQTQTFDSAWAYGVCVIREGSTYKMWYGGWNTDTAADYLPGARANKIGFRIGYATSSNGFDWTKAPGSGGAGSVFGLGPPGSQDAKGVAQPYVIKEGSTYRMWYEGYDGTTWRIFRATSTDGLVWTRQGLALDIGASGSLDALGARDPVVVTRNGHYELWYQGQSAGSPYYHALRATSSDGVTWTKYPNEVILRPASPPVAVGDPIWNPSDPTAKLHVDSIIVNPDNSCRVFFAKQMISFSSANWGPIENRRYYIFTEVVNP